MKLKTDIHPRRDGTVLAATPNATYVFAQDGADLVCDVKNEADAALLLATGNFYPDDRDHDKAIKVLNEHNPPEDAPVEVAPAKRRWKK